MTLPSLPRFPGYPDGTVRPLMRPEGTGASGVMYMGEALGENEEHDQLPFRPHADAGSVLARAMLRAGIPRDTLTLTNVVWYRPPRNWLDGAPWETDAINLCTPLNDALVRERQPRVIVALGGIAFRELTGMSGKKQGIESCRGFIVPSLRYSSIPVVGTYHPSFLHRGSKQRLKGGTQAKVVAAGGGTKGMALLGAMIRDLQLAQRIAVEGVPVFKGANYQLGAAVDEWMIARSELALHPHLDVYYDLETLDSITYDAEEDVEVVDRQITQLQIMYGSTVVVSDYDPAIIPHFRAILEGHNRKFDWNGRAFDRPILRHYEIRTDIGEWIDLQDMWHHSQPDLPRGLQYATSFFCPECGPWKHTSHSNPHYYGALDVHMAREVHLGLVRAMGALRSPASGRSLLDGHQEQVVQLTPVLDRMSARGIGVDEEQRLELDAEFTATQEQIFERVQSLVPEEVRNVEPKEGYKRNNKLPQACLEAAGQAHLFGADRPGADGTQGDPSGTGNAGVSNNRVHDTDGTTFVTRPFRDAKTHSQVIRWAKLLPFLPNGHDQVMRYLKHQRSADVSRREETLLKKGVLPHLAHELALKQSKWEIPTDYKTEKESTGEEGLRRLQKTTGDPVIPLVLDYREVGKARSTYVQGWAPGKDGRVHPFFWFKPATGQLSSTNPSGQVFPKHAQIARKMRRMITARPGHHLLTFDYKGFHVLTLGFESQDPQYVRLARIDMHSFFVLCGMLRLEPFDHMVQLTDADLADRLAWYRSSPTTYPAYEGRTFARIRDEIGKHAILAYGNGQGARGLYMKNRDSFPTLRDAQKVQDSLDHLFPLPFQWKRRVTLLADRQAHLLSRYGYVRWFWDVFHRRPAPANYHPLKGETVMEGNAGRWVLSPGDDHEASISYLIQNDAFGIKRGAMVALGSQGLDGKYGLITEIHDDLTFDCPDEYEDECLETVKGIMESPSPYLRDPIVAPEGLWAGVDVKRGRNWDWKDPDNPEGMEGVRI